MSFRTLTAFDVKANWPAAWGQSGTLVIALNKPVVGTDGVQYPKTQNAGRPLSTLGFHFESAITVASGTGTATSIANLPTTDTAIPVNTAHYDIYIYDSKGKMREKLGSNFHLHESVNGSSSSFTWQQWVVAQNFKQGSSQLPMIGDRATMQAMVDAASHAPIGVAGGDLSGNYPEPTVVKLQGRTLASTAPLTGQAIVYNGSQWAPGTGSQSSAVDVASYATGGNGTQGSPWTGWDTAITWTAFTEYRFRKGYFAYTTAPNFGLNGIALIGEAGTYFQHQGTGNAFVVDAGPAEGVDWIYNTRIENIRVLGNYSTLTGTGSATSGTNAVVGTGTSFLTQCAVGNSVSFSSGMGTESRIITAIADDTHLTVDANWVGSRTNQPMKVGKTTNGFFIRGTSTGRYTQIGAHDVNVGFYSEGMNNTIVENFGIVYNDPTTFVGYNVQPQYGIQLAARGADVSTVNTFIDPICGAAEKAGIWIRRQSSNGSFGNTILNGSLGYGRGKGLVIDGDNNTVIYMDIEATGPTAIELNGESNLLLNVYSLGEGITSSISGLNKIIGGRHYGVTIANTASFNEISGVNLGAAGLVDNSTSTTRLNNRSTGSGLDYKTFINNVLPRKLYGSISASAYATDASVSSEHAFTIFGNFTLSNPTNPTDGQRVTWAIRQDGAGGYAITYGSKFRMPRGRAFPLLQPVVSDTTYIAAKYNLTDDKWDILDEGTADYEASPAFVTLTDNTTVTWQLYPSTRVQNATLTLGGNRTLAIAGAVSGSRGVLIVKQDATGNRTLTLPAGSKVEGGGAGVVTLSTAANAIDRLEWEYDGTNYFWRVKLNFT